jgi:hypothetical protein|tara:strand:- start:6556 stop:6810 length:255 start_codon:yes stop_codon:yes gene_type:complete
LELKADSTISLSVAMILKIGFLIMIVTGSWYQAQMKFAEQESRIKDLENKVVVLDASIEGMETAHIEQLEETNRSLMQRLGLKR